MSTTTSITPPGFAVTTLKDLLGVNQHDLILPYQRTYESATLPLGVPRDIVSHPFVIMNRTCDRQIVQALLACYPAMFVLEIGESESTIWGLSSHEQIPNQQLKQRLRSYLASGLAIKLPRWVSAASPASCEDADCMLSALELALSHLMTSGLIPNHALTNLALLVLGLACGPLPKRTMWLEPRRVFELAIQRSTHLVSHIDELAECEVGNVLKLGDECLLRLAACLAPFNWQGVKWDLFGPLYTAHLTQKEKRKHGVFFTPPELVDLVLNTSGVCANVGGDGLILEPCAGTGAFVVRLLARIRQIVPKPQQREQIRHTLRRLTAIEPDLAAFQLLTLNIAIQWAGACGDQPERLPECHLALTDALITYTPFANTTSDAAAVPLPLYTQQASVAPPVQWVKEHDNYAYVIGNPPYVGESGNRTLFAQYRSDSFWQQFSESKMDFLQYFIVLGLSKIQAREGGRICLLTSAYWLTADGARRLRDFVLGQTWLKKVVFIEGETSRFNDAPGHHNIVVLLERRRLASERDIANVEVVTTDYTRTTSTPVFATSSLEQARESAATNMTAMQMQLYPEPQATLRGKPWFLQVDTEYLDVIRTLEQHPTLDTVFAAHQGVVPGAQRVGQAELAALGADWVAVQQIHEGEGIYVLTEAEVKALSLPPAEIRYLVPFVKNSKIKPYHVLRDESLWLLYLRHDQVTPENCPRILAHLARFAPLLRRKREYQLGRRDWYHIHWPRAETIFREEKVMTAGRGSQPAFAWVDTPLFAATDVYLIVNRANVMTNYLSLLALTGILNSSLGSFWFAHRTKAKGNQREFFSGALQQFPLPHQSATDYAQWMALHTQLEECVRKVQELSAVQKVDSSLLLHIDELVFTLYELTPIVAATVHNWETRKRPQ